MLIDHKSDDNGGHAGVHHVGISSIVISMLIDDASIVVDQQQLNVGRRRGSEVPVSSIQTSCACALWRSAAARLPAAAAG
eukprot:scaffold44331_cov56-Phaeocystis_antarctica.AAC.2